MNVLAPDQQESKRMKFARNLKFSELRDIVIGKFRRTSNVVSTIGAQKLDLYLPRTTQWLSSNPNNPLSMVKNQVNETQEGNFGWG